MERELGRELAETQEHPMWDWGQTQSHMEP
jgi:hypothetical protein